MAVCTRQRAELGTPAKIQSGRYWHLSTLNEPSMDPRHENTEHSALALWGIAPEPDILRKVHDQSLLWLSRHGCEPDLMGTDLDKGNMVRTELSQRRLT